jgi:2-keto-4-pentenoate hydratase/2-oxohepta-3-ene-1,7-dioic acid hydratase in catechol pathway
MKIICIGLNYRKHAAELNWQLPEKPLLFLKPDSSILKNNKPFFLPDFSNMIQYEVEVVLKISKLGKGIAPEFAYRYFDEVSLGIDITARDLQQKVRKTGDPWEICKSFDGSAPVGKFIPVEKLRDLKNLDFRLEVNEKIVQQGNTSDMIFSFDKIISYVSQFFTLKTGDLIFTGTPPGIGNLNRNDNLVAYLEDEPVMDFYIR